MIPGGGENADHWRHRDIVQAFSTLDVGDAVAQADTFRQLARWWEDGVHAFAYAIEAALPAAWSGLGADAAISSLRRYLGRARDLVSALEVVPGLVEAAAEAVVATKWAIPDAVDVVSVPAWSTDPGGLRESIEREAEARAVLRERYVLPFAELDRRIPMIPLPSSPFTVGSTGASGSASARHPNATVNRTSSSDSGRTVRSSMADVLYCSTAQRETDCEALSIRTDESPTATSRIAASAAGQASAAFSGTTPITVAADTVVDPRSRSGRVAIESCSTSVGPVCPDGRSVELSDEEGRAASTFEMGEDPDNRSHLCAQTAGTPCTIEVAATTRVPDGAGAEVVAVDASAAERTDDPSASTSSASCVAQHPGTAWPAVTSAEGYFGTEAERATSPSERGTRPAGGPSAVFTSQAAEGTRSGTIQHDAGAVRTGAIPQGAEATRAGSSHHGTEGMRAVTSQHGAEGTRGLGQHSAEPARAWACLHDAEGMRAGASGQGLGWVSVNVGGPGAGGGGGYRGADGLDAGDDRGAGATSATMGAGCFAGAVVPTAADASKNGGVRDVPVYLVTEANTDVLLGCSLPTVTGGVIGGVRGEGHDSAVRGAR